MKQKFLFETSPLLAKAIKALQVKCELLTFVNPKGLKSIKNRYITGVLMLSPGYLSGYDVCLYRSDGCTRSCLNTSGQGGIVKGGARSPEKVIEISNSRQQARMRRTKKLFALSKGSTSTPAVPSAFGEQIHKEIKMFEALCRKFEYRPCLRLNGTSDLCWEEMPVLAGKNIMVLHPEIQFYDYTKWPIKIRLNRPANYHLTYSYSDRPGSKGEVVRAIKNGTNTAVVFRIKKNNPLPSEYFGFPVIDGDASDLRFLDPYPVIVGLRAKGFAQTDETGFVVDLWFQENNPIQEELDFDGGKLFPDFMEE